MENQTFQSSIPRHMALLVLLSLVAQYLFFVRFCCEMICKKNEFPFDFWQSENRQKRRKKNKNSEINLYEFQVQRLLINRADRWNFYSNFVKYSFLLFIFKLFLFPPVFSDVQCTCNKDHVSKWWLETSKLPIIFNCSKSNVWNPQNVAHKT